MYISPGLREGSLFVGDSLLTVAAVLVCIQAEQEGGYSVLVCFNSPELRGGNRLAGGSLRTIARFLFAYKKNGNMGICFGVFQHFHTMYLSPGLRGGHLLAGSSLFTVAAVLVCIQAEPDGGDLVLACLKSFIPCTLLPGCAGDTRLPVALFSRWQ